MTTKRQEERVQDEGKGGFSARPFRSRGSALVVSAIALLAGLTPGGALAATYLDGGQGALDIDVSPEKAEVYIDGTRVGVADNYDGFPAYLWLDPGTYDLVVYHEGFKTLARQVTIYPGQVVDVDNHLPRGESVRPEDLQSKETKNRDERLRRDRVRRGDLDRDLDLDLDVAETTGVGHLRLAVTPGSAVLYLDGHFLGTAEEIAELSTDLLLEPGRHTLEILHPSHGSKKIEIEMAAGDEEEIEVHLDRP